MSGAQSNRNHAGSQPDKPGSRRGGGPRLVSEEWIVLLDIYLRHRAGASEKRAREIDRAVEVLSRMASHRGRPRAGARVRSSDGLLRRLTELRALDRGEAANAPREAREIWLRYGENPEGCAAAAAAILRREGDPGLIPIDNDRPPSRSRGPVPSFGSFDLVRSDGYTQVYLMELVADEARTSMARTERGAIFKIGRTNAPLRREAELNEGFPPGIGLAWRLITTLECNDAQTAHEIEQAILDRCETEGYCLARESCRWITIGRES